MHPMLYLRETKSGWDLREIVNEWGYQERRVTMWDEEVNEVLNFWVLNDKNS